MDGTTGGRCQASYAIRESITTRSTRWSFSQQCYMGCMDTVPCSHFICLYLIILKALVGIGVFLVHCFFGVTRLVDTVNYSMQHYCVAILSVVVTFQYVCANCVLFCLYLNFLEFLLRCLTFACSDFSLSDLEFRLLWELLCTKWSILFILSTSVRALQTLKKSKINLHG